MIAQLRGDIAEINLDSLVLLVNDVGYELFCSSPNLSGLQLGASVKFYIHTHVREDALQLFGFLSKVEKQFFLSLIKINGIGPKMALHILSGAPLDRIIEMIEAEDVKALSKLPKVGKKTAEQMILSMKGKLVLSEDRATVSGSSVQKELTSALTNLGFRTVDIEEVLHSLPKDIELEEGLRQSLSQLTSL